MFFIQQFWLALIFSLISLKLSYATHVKDTFMHNYASSIASLVNLWQIEDELIKDMEAYGNLMQQKDVVINLALENLYVVHNQSEQNPETCLSNPLNSFALLRRMHLDWPKWQTYMSQNAGDEYDRQMERSHNEMPTEWDLAEAAFGLYLIQITYNLTPKDMAKGLLNGKQYDAELNALDCYYLANFTSNRTKYDDAINWYEEASKRYTGPFSNLYEWLKPSRADVSYALAEHYKLKKRYVDAMRAINDAVSLNSHDEKILKFQSSLQERMSNMKGCQGKYPINTRLHCRYNHTTTPFLRLAPLKMEELHSDPYMVLYHDIISDKEIAELKHKAKPELKRGLVGLGKIAKGRSAHSTTFDENEQLKRRITDMTGFDVTESDWLQVANYGIGGHHYNHVDYFNYTQPEDEAILEYRGDRIAAVLFYLNDVEQGGQTIFPRIQVAVPPKKGSALHWYHLDETSHGNRKSQHASCTVIVGSKWVAIKLLYEKNQMFRRPCYNQKLN